MLRQRVVTGIIGGALYLGAVWYGGLPSALLFVLLAVVGYSELLLMRGWSRLSAPALVGYMATLMWLVGAIWQPFAGTWMPEVDSLSALWLLLVLFVFLSISVISKNRYTFQDMTYLFAGTLYVGLPFHCAILLRVDGKLGLAYFLFMILTIWTTDTAAYFVGRTLKGPKLWPAISPNKTVSGSLGGVVAAVIVGMIFANVMGLSMGSWMLLAALLSVFGQFGDFVESGLKRALDVKDSGTILPGHGGVLDRFDSFLFAAPIAYYGTMLLVS
ncbi:phosphatidate cytidylyltransferase [Tumebacillus permanentifrigoris]|uniref:Phosphatidate cytidylyltransferase n=1 Tax=Tumebacillus permanentifrigoris TaxID=378543 RepID=A0A316D7X1_9BACL|nr:phosphatidate cytidylyltransferase [Tumebacillus permanentifrigoris]PWK12677.1 phosphatidate cytidylyltransferase [Tumebacillus permanentifrigoris]